MATETVEVEEVRTIEEEVTICDECGREVDPDGGEYRSKVSTVGPRPTLHFCSECIAQFRDSFETYPERLNREWWGHGATLGGASCTLEERLKTSLDTIKKCFLGAALSFILAIASIFAFNVTVWVLVVPSIGCILTMAVVGESVLRGMQHVKTANESLEQKT